VWAAILADGIFGGLAGGIFFAFVPTYMYHQLGFSLKSAGFMASVPQLAKLVAQLTIPQTADTLIKDGCAKT
jgi:cyanate permease